MPFLKGSFEVPCKSYFYFYSVFRALERFEDMLFLTLARMGYQCVEREAGWEGQTGTSDDKRPTTILSSCLYVLRSVPHRRPLTKTNAVGFCHQPPVL